MDMCEKEHRKIDVLRRNSGIKRAIDITQLYLANQKMVMIPDFSKLRMLRYLWLNNNMITKISSMPTSCCLTELYLQNNKITSISGALSHLSCLQVLLLHNNQLESLEASVAELRRAQQLHTLSFFLNPFAENPQYRNYVAHHLPSVLILDRREVKREEKTSAFQMFSPERYRVRRSVAFGRRAEFGPLAGNRVQSSDSSWQSTSGTISGKPLSRRSHQVTVGQTVNASVQRSIMLFSTDWTTIPSGQYRHSTRAEPKIITIKFI